VPVPRRASYIRVLMLELNRIANHLLWLGPFLADVGAQTPFFYIFREREMIYDLWEAATGQRLINNNYFRIGGVAVDLPYGWLEKCEDFCDWFGPKIDEYEKLITDNPIFRKRIVGLGTISREQAINWSLSGPMLRASGVPWDLRKVDHYECYDDFEWSVAWATEGDCFARYRVRIEEMRQSLKILRQAIKMIPGGPTENLEARRMAEGKKSEWYGFDYQYVAKKVAPPSRFPTVSSMPGWNRARGNWGCSSWATTMSPPGAGRSVPLISTTSRSSPTFSRVPRWPTSWPSSVRSM
jgi:NAD(P)H-quinone oxidoreductase subunit H